MVSKRKSPLSHYLISNSFSFCSDGLLMVSYESSKSDHGFTNLYRFTPQPPYGLTPVKNWPGRQWIQSPPFAIVSIAYRGPKNLLLCSTSKHEVAVVEASGLTEQFTPALPEASEGVVIVHPEGATPTFVLYSFARLLTAPM